MTISSALFPSCGWHCQRSTWALAMSIGTRRKSFASTNGATLTMTSSDFRLSEWAVFMFLLYILCQLVPYHGSQCCVFFEGPSQNWVQSILWHRRGSKSVDAETSPPGLRTMEQDHWLLPRFQHASSKCIHITHSISFFFENNFLSIEHNSICNNLSFC